MSTRTSTAIRATCTLAARRRRAGRFLAGGPRRGLSRISTHASTVAHSDPAALMAVVEGGQKGPGLRELSNDISVSNRPSLCNQQVLPGTWKAELTVSLRPTWTKRVGS